MAPETVVATAHPTFLKSIGTFIKPILLFAVAIILAIYLPDDMEIKGTIVASTCIIATIILLIGLATDLFRIYYTKYTFTTSRIIAKQGFISTRSSEVRIQDIRGLSIRKTVLGRIFGYSTAEIGTAATGGVEMRIRDVRGLDSILRNISASRAS